MSEVSQLQREIARRRTFAIISHPDAGKTTLTEKLLLYGGAIRLAGSVKARKAARHATSDWMEIEKQRGISVTSSVMQFEYDGYCINILDTPGHQDFSEDTYRTLVAADAAVMLLDGSRGVEEQTIKLFHVCRMRGIPIFTFVNKMDRAAKDPFALMEELEEVLGIRACPVTWPIGIHGDFKGVYRRDKNDVELFDASVSEHGQRMAGSTSGNVDDPALRELLGEEYHTQLCDDIALLDAAGDPFDLQRILAGELTPMFFGSAMTNFGVQTLLERFLQLAPPPGPRAVLGSEEAIQPDNTGFSGFIFKIQANMNAAHRDRIAFLRICSGKFERGMEVWHAREGKRVRLSQPQQFMADARQQVEEAWPGDIIGLFDPGMFHLSDTLCDGNIVAFEQIPMFAPEHFARVSAETALKRKAFIKGVEQIAEEGAIQIFRRPDIGREELIIGVVGILQMDVLQYRMQGEYNVTIRRETLPFRYVRWITACNGDWKTLKLTSTTRLALDAYERQVLLFENEWSIRWALENNEGLVLSEIGAN